VEKEPGRRIIALEANSAKVQKKKDYKNSSKTNFFFKDFSSF